MTSRRQFLSASLGASAAWLSSCTEEEIPKVDPADRAAWMDPGPLHPLRTTVNGLPMHALVSVDAAPPGAPPIVLVHGSGLSGQYMIPTARELTRDFRVFLPDLPGYGDSGDPGKALNVPQLADWLVAWMSAIDLERAALLGNSFGCQVIADLAARYPQRVEAAVLQGPTTPINERSAFWQFVRWRQNQRYNPDWLGDVTMVDYKKAGLWRLIRSFSFQVTDRIEEKIPLIRAPVLVICGEEDPITGPQWGQKLIDLAPHGRLAVIPDVAHTLVFTAPVQVAAATREFVTQLYRSA